MLSKSEIKTISTFQEDKTSLEQQLVVLNIIPKNLSKTLHTINTNLLEFSKKMYKKDYTPEEIEKMLAKNMEYKVYITSINTDTDFMKMQVEAVRSNQKLVITQKRLNNNTGKLNKDGINEELVNQLLGLDSYIAFLKELKVKIKNINDMLDKFFIVLTTQMKTDRDMFLNADKISK